MPASVLPWYQALDPVTVRVRCGGEVHRVTWRRGRLVLEDHNLTAERSLAAFGGVPCPCMAVFDWWIDRKSRRQELASALSDLVPAPRPYESRVVVVSDPPDALYQVSPGVGPGMPPQLAQAFLAKLRQEWMQTILPDAFVHRLWLADVMQAARRWDLLPLEVRISADGIVRKRVVAAVVDGMLSWRHAFPGARPSIKTVVMAASEKRG